MQSPRRRYGPENMCFSRNRWPLTLADARDLVATAAESERVLMVSQNYRFRAPARAVQNLIKSR